jgi:hypothetical protein
MSSLTAFCHCNARMAGLKVVPRVVAAGVLPSTEPADSRTEDLSPRLTVLLLLLKSMMKDPSSPRATDRVDRLEWPPRSTRSSLPTANLTSAMLSTGTRQRYVHDVLISD